MSFDKYTWAEQLLADDLPDGAKVVGIRLALKYADVQGHCFPSQARLATDTARSDRAVRRATDELRTGGYLTWASGGGRRPGGNGNANLYKLLTPPKNPDADVHANPDADVHVPGENPDARDQEPGRSWQRTRTQASDQPSIEPTKEPSIHGGTDGASYEEWKDQVFEKIRDSPKVPASVITRITDDSESKKDLLRAELSKAFQIGHDHGAVARALVGRGGWENVTVVSAVMASRLRDWLTNNPTPATAAGASLDLSDWFGLIDGVGESCLIPPCPRLGRWRNDVTGGAMCDDHALREIESRKAVVA